VTTIPREIPAISAVPTAVDPGVTLGRGARFGLVIGAHAICDFFSALIIPILSVLEGRIGMSAIEGAILIGVAQVSSGLIQPFAGRLADAVGSRYVAGLGLALTAIGISLVGFADHYWQLIALQAISAVGIGAFHPPGAAMAGRLAGSRRSLGLTLFFAAGTGGGVIGAASSSGLVAARGVEALVWFMPLGLLAAVVMLVLMRGVAHNAPDAKGSHQTMDAAERRARWRAVWTLYIANVMRFTVNTALVIVVVRWSQDLVLQRHGAEALTPALREKSSLLNGPMQAALLVGMAGGGLLLGSMIRFGRERAALVRSPLLGSIAVIGLAYTSPVTSAMGAEHLRIPIAAVLCVLCGFGFAAVLPITFALAQRLLPHRTSLASGLMMGAAWGPAVIGTVLAQISIDTVGLEFTFWWVGALLAASGLFALRLDKGLLERVAPH